MMELVAVAEELVGTGGGKGGGGGPVNDPTTPGGGSPVPHYFPCTRPPCTAPTGGLPILPIPDEPPINKTPCEKMNVLKDEQSMLQNLNNFIGNPSPLYQRELGLPIGPDGTGNILQGGTITSTTMPQVDLPYVPSLSRLFCWIHTHPNLNPDILPIFSPSDLITIYSLLEYRKSNNQPWANYTELSVGVINWKHEAYFLVIDDINAFTQFASKFDFANQGDNNPELEQMYKEYNIKHNTSTADAEKNFLSFLKSANCGLKVMKANSDFSQFSELSLSNNLVTSTTCL
jgi:hypothetical protein